MDLYIPIFTLKRKKKSNRRYHNGENLEVAFSHSCSLYRICTDIAPPFPLPLYNYITGNEKQTKCHEGIEKKHTGRLSFFRK